LIAQTNTTMNAVSWPILLIAALLTSALALESGLSKGSANNQARELLSGSCGEGVKYSLDTETGELVISGTGDMDDFTPKTIPWSGSEKLVKSVTIQQGVTSIGVYSFLYCSNLKDVSIAESVTSIRDDAFMMCSSLKTITLPASLSELSHTAFDICKVEHLNIAGGQGETFSSRDGILFNKDGTSLIMYPRGRAGPFSIPFGVETINDYAFDGCQGLTSLEIPDSVHTIGEYALVCTGFKTLEIPASVTSINPSALSACGGSSGPILDFVSYKGTSNPLMPGTSGKADVRNACVPPTYSSSSFLGISNFCKSDSCPEIPLLENRCYFVECQSNHGFSVSKRDNATWWEKRNDNCSEYHCDNITGPISWSNCNSTGCTSRTCKNNQCVEEDACKRDNPFPECFDSTCQSDGTCSNISLYNGDKRGCSIQCVPDHGWEEVAKNCTDEILGDLHTPSEVIAASNCYEFECGDDGECRYTALPSCGFLCDSSRIEECKRNAPNRDCLEFSACNEVKKDGLWKSECVYERKKCGENGETSICVDNECVTGLKNQDWSFSIDVIDVIYDMEESTEDIVQAVSALSGLSSDAIKVGLEYDDSGAIIRLYIGVEEVSDAEIIAFAIKEMNNNGGGCQADKFGILCKMKKLTPQDTTLQSDLSWMSMVSTSTLIMSLLIVMLK